MSREVSVIGIPSSGGSDEDEGALPRRGRA
jgi:hypothetical protein